MPSPLNAKRQRDSTGNLYLSQRHLCVPRTAESVAGLEFQIELLDSSHPLNDHLFKGPI